MSEGRAFWDAHHARGHHAHAPNETLVEVASKLTPGAALDVGCGEGHDARWLAAHGWKVTAVDVSSVALERARATPSTVQWKEEDFATWTPPREAFDLVTSHFVHVRPEARADFFSKLAGAVRPGGALLFVAHHASDHSRPNLAELNFTADELHAHLRDWELTYSGTRPRQGVHDTVLWATRRT